MTAYELVHDGLPATLIVDSAAAALMAQGKVDAVVVGADRIAANGDTANKIGTYSLAVNAAQHGVSMPSFAKLFCQPLHCSVMWGMLRAARCLPSFPCRIPFYIAAPTTTVDPSLADGSLIPIEERNPSEVTHQQGAASRCARHTCASLCTTADPIPFA